jgi:hypothetical protein
VTAAKLATDHSIESNTVERANNLDTIALFSCNLERADNRWYMRPGNPRELPGRELCHVKGEV